MTDVTATPTPTPVDAVEAQPVLKKAKVERDPRTIPTQVKWVNVFNNNNKTAAAFYESFLGWKPEFSEHSDHWMQVECPRAHSTSIGLHSLDISTNPGNTVGSIALNMTVKDLTAFHELVKDIEGLKVVMAPTRQMWGGFMASYTSPDGTSLDLLEETAVTAPPAEDKKAEEAVKQELVCAKDEAKEKPAVEGAGLCHLEIPVGDQKRFAKFFSETFDWTFDDCGAAGMFFKTHDPTYKLAGGLVVSEDRFKTPFLYIRVKDINAALEKVKANGGAVVKEKYMITPLYPAMYAAKFTDTEDNAWYLYSDTEGDNKQANLC